MSYQPKFDRFAKGAFDINNNFIGIQAGSEAFLLEDELNELQWIQYEQKAQSNRSILNSGLLYNFPTIDNTTTVSNNVLYIKDKNTLLWSIRDYVPVNVNGYVFRLCGTYRQDIKNSSTNYNNILINLSKLELLTGFVNELVYLEVWFENINYKLNKNIAKYGGEANESSEFSIDDRLNVETTQRVQLKWKIKTAQNKSSLSQIYPADSTSSKYEQAKMTSGEVYSFDDNLYTAKVSEKTRNNNIDGIYYAIPLFLIRRTPNDIQVEDITPVYPKVQTFLYNIKSDILQFGKEDTGIVFENVSNELLIKDKLDRLVNVTMRNIVSNSILSNSITTGDINAHNLTTNTFDSKLIKIFNNNKTKLAKLSVDDSNVLNITNATDKYCDVKINNLTSDTINNRILKLTTTDGTTQFMLQSISNELKVKKILGSSATDSGSVLSSEKIAANLLEMRDLSNGTVCTLKNEGNNVKLLNGSDYASLVVGDLIIKGNSTTIESETVTIADNILLLNSNLTSSITPIEDSGFEVNRGNLANSSLIWNESKDVWTAGIKGKEDVILLKTSPEMDNPLVNGLLTIKNADQNKINLVTPTGSDVKSRINVYQNTTLHSSIVYDGTAAGKKLWSIVTGSSNNKIATINSNNILCNNIGEVSYVSTQGGASNSKPTAKGLNVFYVGTNDRKIYYDTNVDGLNKWLEVGRPSDLPDCDPNFAYDSKPSNFSDSNSKKLFYNGYFYANRVYNAVYNDYAEYFEKGNTIVEPGDVVICDDDNNKSYIKSSEAYSRLVVGVCSDTYGHLLGGEGKASDEDNYIPIGLSGRVNVKVTGDVKKGDLLVTSDIPGVAQASTQYIPGTVIGKALENHCGNSIDRISMLIMNI